MTLEEAAYKQYCLFVSMTSRNPPYLWDELPSGVQDAWKKVIRTCPRIKKEGPTIANLIDSVFPGSIEERLKKLEDEIKLYCKPQR